MKSYDFGGWATKNDLKCSDGRTIRKNAFIDDDGKTVPLVWNHNYANPDNVLGHALLKNKDDGVYAYCLFNNTDNANTAKELVMHGDISSLSIFANKLTQDDSRNVLHGKIREVSLVLAPANPGARIDEIMSHSDESDFSAVIYTGLTLEHGDETENDLEETNNEGENMENENNIRHADTNGNEDDRTVGEVFETLTEDQKKVVYAMIAAALESAGEENKNNEGDGKMKHNVFENDETNDQALCHDAMNAIIGDAKRYGSLKESYLAHAEEYGISDIDWLFPEARNIQNGAPEFIKRTPNAWVSTVMKGVHHTPFSRIKSLFADITGDEARARGYVKGNLKLEEVFGLIKRTTEPTTVYKKQKIDRDDQLDITDFDVVSFLKSEMRGMLDEEIARAIVFGDKRSALSPDKIDESKIRPIVSDVDFYTIKTTVTPGQNETLSHAIINAAVKSQDSYMGSGNLTCFMVQGTVTDALLEEDKDGHRMYKDINDLALAMNVNRIEKVPASVMPTGVYAVIVDLNDYNVGADKGGSVSMFDDFDIDYNQEKYLIETRCSGALVKPYSAIVLKNN